MDESDQFARSESLLEEAHGDQAIHMKPLSSHEKPSATMDPLESLPKPLPRTTIEPPGTRNGQWPQSAFHYQREDTLSRMQWSTDADGNPGRQNYARAYEFHSSEIPGQQRCDMCEFSQTDGNINDAAFEASIQQWITETRHQESVTIRLFVSYLSKYNHLGHSVSFTREAFEAIEKEFELHSATSRIFLTNNNDPIGLDFTWTGQDESQSSDDDSSWFVSNFEPVAEKENWAMSLKYDHRKQRTDAMIFTTRDGEWLLERVLHELLMLHQAWKQFRVLPEVFLQAYLGEFRLTVNSDASRVIQMERELGATRSWEDSGEIVDEWPQHIDVLQNTAKMHEILYAIALNGNILRKVKQVQQQLGEMQSRLENAQTVVPKPSTGTGELDQYSTWTDTLLRRTDAKIAGIHERAQVQANLLFSMVSQKDSREGISMAQSAFVFTFITALFLPCTVVASIFSMSMFDWQPDTESGSRVSDKFWIYWAFSLPLTIIVMGGWYWWSVKGMKLWNRSSSEDNKDAKGWRAKSRWVRFLGKRPKTQSSSIATTSQASTAASSSNRSSVSVRSRVSRAS